MSYANTRLNQQMIINMNNKSAEEVLANYFSVKEYKQHFQLSAKDAIKAMEEYANQFKITGQSSYDEYEEIDEDEIDEDEINEDDEEYDPLQYEGENCTCGAYFMGRDGYYRHVSDCIC